MMRNYAVDALRATVTNETGAKGSRVMSGHSGRTGTIFASLTERQRTIALLVADGRHNRAIAHELGTSETAVRMAVSKIYKELDICTYAGHQPRVRLARLVWEDR